MNGLLIFKEKLDGESCYIRFMLGDSQVQEYQHKNKEKKTEFQIENKAFNDIFIKLPFINNMVNWLAVFKSVLQNLSLILWIVGI